MKTKCILVSLIAALSLFAQSPTPAPSPSSAAISVPTPSSLLVSQPVTVKLSPSQISDIVAALSASGISLPPAIKSLHLTMITTGTLAGGAVVRIGF